jgi:transposase
MKPKPNKQRKVKAIKPRPYRPVNPDAGGIDVGASEHWVAVPYDRDENPVRMFPAFTPDLLDLLAWLLACGITTVAMESTGNYWIPLYDLLEAYGIKVFLIDPRMTKSRKKTDILDCQRLQQMHSYGQLDPSFRPPQSIRQVRTIVRQQESLTRDRARHILHMQKALHEMNIQLDLVLADITGQTGMHIIRAIVQGEHDPVVLAQFRDPRCKHSTEDIIKALQGSYHDQHVFTLRQALQLYDTFSLLLEECATTLDELFGTFTPSAFCEDSIPATGKAHRKGRKDPQQVLRQHLYDLCGVDITEVDGIDCLNALIIISETGPDMSPWPTSKHYGAWATLAPNNRISGGKVLAPDYHKSNHRVGQAFRKAAQSLARSKCGLGAYYRKIQLRHGSAQANKATAYKLARIVYTMLKKHKSYKSMDQHAYDQHYQDRMLRNLKRTAAQLNFQLVPLDQQVPVEG